MFIQKIRSFNVDEIDTSLIGCLMSQSKTLGLMSSWIFATLMYAAICYTLCALTITATLRCIALAKKSEQFGIQFFGPDDIGIQRIRWISFLITFFLISIGLLGFQSPPGFFYSLYNEQTVSIPQIQEQDPFNTVYTIPLFVALVVNSFAKLYTIVLRWWMSFDDTYLSLSFESVIGFLLVVLIQLLSSYLSRIYRIYFYYPIILMLCCDIFPLVIIKKNSKMKQELQEKVKKLFSMKFFSFVINILKKRYIVVAPQSID
jgi:hypothetical protein